MNHPQGEVLPIPTTSQTNQETQELIRLFYQTKKKLPILIYKEMNDESVKPVLNMFAEIKTNHESPTFSINDAKDFTASLISVTAII